MSLMSSPPPPPSLFLLLTNSTAAATKLILTTSNSPEKENKLCYYFLATTRKHITEFKKDMSEVKDTSFKLFGKTIQMSAAIHNHRRLINSSTIIKDLIQNTPTIPLEGGFMKTKERQEQNIESLHEDPRTPDSSAEELIGQATSSGMSEDLKIPNAEKQTSSLETGDEEVQSDLNNSDGKTLTKPDKLLPCPRCSSMDTKFCYYNNYNISQARYFCKGCQRYWTAGGTMRNVPVGSGRRKNKRSAALHYRQILVSEAVQAARADAANRIHHPTGSVLTFGSASPLCEPSSFFLADKSQNCVRIRFNGQEHRTPVTCRDGEIEDDISCGSSSTVPSPIEKGFSGGPESVLTNNMQGSTPHVPCFPMPPWPYPWNNSVHWRPQTPPAIGPSGYPVPIYPMPPYWGCMVPNAWNMPYLSSKSPSPNHSALSSSPNSQTLGKHSRDGSMLRPSKPGIGDRFLGKDPKRGVLLPKTLRIIEPNEAAKSSIWSTLTIKTDNTDSGTGASLFKPFSGVSSKPCSHV